MIFNLSTISVMLSIACVAGLTLLVFLKGKKRKIEIIFILFCISILFWLIGTLMMFLSKNETQAIFWDRFVYIGVVFIPVLMHHFSIVFAKVKGQKKLLILGYTIAFIFLIISRTNYFVKDLFIYDWGVHTKAQLFHHIFLLIFFTDLSLLFINVYKYYKKTRSNLEIKRAQYVFFAFLALIGIGLFAYLPAYSISVPPFSFLAGVFFAFILAYAILKYRLLDIRLIIKRSTIYFLSFLTTVGLGTGLALILHRYSQIHATYIGIIDIIFVLLIFNPLKNIIRKIANRIMFRAVYTYQEALKELSTQVSTIIRLTDLLNLISNVLFKTMQVERVGIILNLPQKNDFYSVKLAGFEEKTAIHLSQKDFLIETIKKDKELLVAEELVLMLEDEQKEEKKEKLKLLIKKLQAIKADVALPLIAHQELIGLIILGPKEDQNAYSKQDLDILDNLSVQLALALENARLFNYMEELVTKKTQQVKEKAEEVRRTNLKLKKANQIREEFLSIASHQLRTPLSAAWSVMSSFADGTLENETPAERQRFYKMAFDSLDRLNNIVNDLLDGAEVERKKLNIQKKEINVINIIKDSVAKGKEEADKKGISLVLKIDDNTPKTIFADEKYLRMVFVNLLDNAIKYTPEDLSVERKKILIKVFSKTKSIETEKDKKKKRFLVFIIQDQGIGVPKAEQNNLFKQFKRASNARKVDISGTGLGLYIVKKVIQQHNGTIEMQSEGEDKGTRFRVEVPV
ncbi:MAG: ATP-binding protein [bacterium]